MSYYQLIENLSILACVESTDVDTQFLHSFLLTVDAGSMSEAARRLDLTPAAVAQQIRALERELGTPLLARAGRTVGPTEAGHRLAERSRALLREFGNLKAAVNEEVATGELRIGAINTALLSLVPAALARFSNAHPQVRVMIQSGSSAELFEGVQRGDLDAAICLRPRRSPGCCCATSRWWCWRRRAWRGAIRTPCWRANPSSATTAASPAASRRTATCAAPASSRANATSWGRWPRSP
jgi:DNA-binding transcriptional LysR family regulator